MIPLKESIETRICQVGHCCYGLCWVDLRIIEENDKRGLSGIICFIEPPHENNKILDGRNVILEIRLFNRTIIDENGVSPEKLQHKLIGVELQQEKSGPVSLDNEHYHVGFTFIARGMYNSPLEKE